jgi:HEAT repeat protein
MHQYAKLSWFAGAVVLYWTGVVTAQADSVAQLRQALKTPTQDIEARSRVVKQAADMVGGLGDLRRGLALQEWRDEDVDPQIAAADQQQRGELQHRFEQAVRDVFAHGEPASKAALADMLADLGVTVRAVNSRDSLARVFSADLAALASQGPPLVRAAAAHALGLIHADVAVARPALTRMMKGDESQRLAAVTALAAMMRVSGQMAIHGKAAIGVSGSCGDVVAVAQAVLPLAGAALADAAPAVRRRAVETIGWAASGAGGLLLEGQPCYAVPDVVPGGRPPEKPDDLLPLFVALKRLAPQLARALADSDAQVRALTRRTLQLVADLRQRVQSEPDAAAGVEALRVVLVAAVPCLAEGISDADWQARQSSINVLEMLGVDAAPAAGALAKALNDPDRFVRWAAARALGRLAPQGATAVPGLVALLDDADSDLGLAAAAALEKFGPAALPAALALAQTVRAGHAAELRLAAIHALEHIGSAAAPPAVPALSVTLTDPDARLRKAAAVALGRFGPAAKEATEALRQLRADSDSEVQQAAADALLRIATGTK